MTNTAADRLGNFTGWLQQNKLQGELGEIGSDNNNPAWILALQTAMETARQSGLQITYWAGGLWWGDYPLSTEPTSGGDPAPQMAVLDDMTGALATVGDPSLAGTATPNSTVTLTENGTTLASTVTDATGHWSTMLHGLAMGHHVIVASQSVAGGDVKVAALSFIKTSGSSPISPTVTVAGLHDEYTLSAAGGTTALIDQVSGRDGAQSLSGVNEVRFLDGTGVIDSGGQAELVAHLYQAAFGRSADVGGVGYWTGLLNAGAATPSLVASVFAGSAEFTTRYGALSDPQYIDQLYQNVLGRPADSGGSAFWTAQLSGGTSRGDVLLGFSRSFENIENTIGVTGDANEAEAYRLYQAALHRTPDIGLRRCKRARPRRKWRPAFSPRLNLPRSIAVRPAATSSMRSIRTCSAARPMRVARNIGHQPWPAA